MRTNNLFSLPTGLLLLGVLLFPAGCKYQPRDSAVFDKAETTHVATANPNNYGRPVRLRGVVTYYDPEWRLLFLQDASGGIFINLKEQVPDLIAGRLIEVSGKLAPGNRGIDDPQFQILGSAPMPTPQSLPHGGDFAQARLSQWVQIHGTVRLAAIEDGRLTLSLADGADRVRARILMPPQIRPINFVGVEVQVSGVSAAAVDDKGNTTGIQVFVTSFDQITANGGGKFTNPFSSKVQPFSVASDHQDPGKLVHLTGTVVEQKLGRVLVVSDGTSNVAALLSDDSQLAPGDSVELLGFTSSSSTHDIEDTLVRITARRTIPKEPLSNETLRSIRELKSLSVESAAKSFPVDVRGTVTYFDPLSSLLFVQDATAGAYVDIHSGTPEIKLGDMVHIEGFSGPGDFAPIIARPTITRLGLGPMPEPQALSLQTLASGINDGGWVQIAGIVHSVSQLSSQHLFKLVVGGNAYAVQLPHSADIRSIEKELLDSQIRIGGVCGTVFNEKRQLIGLKFFVPDIKFVEIVEPAPDESAASIRPIITLLRFDPFDLSIHRAKIRGVVTLRDSDQSFYLQDASAGIYVVSEQKTKFHTGQSVEASGFAAVGHDGPFLEDATVDPVNDALHIEPVKLTAGDLTTSLYSSQLVTLDGRLLERVTGSNEDTMLLRVGNLVLPTHLQGAKIPGEVRRGSLLQVTGILQSVGPASQNSFRVALPSSVNVRVIEAASWWTAENVARTLSVVVIGVLAILLWVSMSAYRVRSYQARHDLLTGLPNRRAALEYLERQMVRAMREKSSLGVILADVDHFKKVNDTYGHQTGDAVLKKIAELLSAALRPYDAVGRYGGEEFLIVVPNCDEATVLEIAERIRVRIMEELFVSVHHEQTFHMTCSFGVAIASDPLWIADSILAAADQALYAAKNSGRNRVQTADIVAVESQPQPVAL